nr:hypothetical protein [Planctomycetota bacterium]
RPAAGPFISTYIERYHAWRRNGDKVPEDQRREWFPHPALEKLLSESFGVLSYQEDVMLASQELAGFASKDANRLRKALGRSDTAQRLQELASAFVRGCRERGVTDDVIEKVWSMISSFAGYSFTKAHSASYAVVSFQCAWLKAHHPAYFMARVIANEGGYYHAAAYIEEARRLGVEVRAPCVLASTWKTRREGPGALRVGFQLVKGIGGDTAARIEHERGRLPFAGIRDFHVRCAIAADELMALCLAGALDALRPELNAAQRRWLCGIAVRDGHCQLREGQQAIGFDQALTDPPVLPLKDLTEADRRWRQHGVLGFLPDAHLLALWRLPFRRWRCADVVAANKGRRLELVGINLTRKPVVATYLVGTDGRSLPAPRHVPMAFVTIEDEGGLAETVWFPEAYGRFGPVLERFAPLRVVGVVLVEFGSATLSVESAQIVDDGSSAG